MTCADCMAAFIDPISTIDFRMLPGDPPVEIRERSMRGLRELMVAAADAAEVRMNNTHVGVFASTLINGTAYCAAHGLFRVGEIRK